MQYSNEYWETFFKNYNAERNNKNGTLDFKTIPDVPTKSRRAWRILMQQHPISIHVLCHYNNGISLMLRVLADNSWLVEPVSTSCIHPQMPKFPTNQVRIYKGNDDPYNGMTWLKIISDNGQFLEFYTAYIETRFITFPLPSAFLFQKFRIENTDKDGMTQVLFVESDGFNYIIHEPTFIAKKYPVYQWEKPGDKGVPLTPNQMQTRNVILGFIDKYIVVALKKNDVVYFNRLASRNRHLPITNQDLKKDFYDYLDIYPFATQPNKTNRDDYYERLIKFFNDEIKQHQHGLRNLIPLASTQVMFDNGYYDLKTKVFTEIAPENKGAYFNLFSIDMLFNADENNTTNFDKLLGDIFKDKPDEQKREGEPSYTVDEKIHFAYQVIGALITPISLKKSIFLFQGVSNGGKTRLSNLIANLLPKNNIRVLSSLSNLGDVENYGLNDPVRLVFFKEAYGNRVSIEKFVSLKALSLDDGDVDVTEIPLKFLINTNHKIEYPLQNGTPKSLTNRIVVVPFATEMDNTSEGVKNFEANQYEASDRKISYFENEKMAIIHKALDAFSEVIQNGSRFCCDFPINMYVEENEKVHAEDSQEIQARIRQARSLPFSEDNGSESICQLIAEIFKPTDRPVNGMTTKKVMEIVNGIRPKTYNESYNNVVGKHITKAFNGEVKLKNGQYNMTTRKEDNTEK